MKQNNNRTYMVAGSVAVAIVFVLILVRLLSSSGEGLFGLGNNADIIGSDAIKPIARANNDIITNYDLLVRQRIYFLENRIDENETILQETRDKILKMLIGEKLQGQFADQSNIPNYQNEARQQLNEIAKSNQQTMPDMLKMMAERGISEDDILNYVAGNIRWRSVLFGLINQSSVATPVDINEKINSKRRLIGKNIYQVMGIRIYNANNDLIERVTNIVKRNPAGWRSDLTDDITAGRLEIFQWYNATAQQFGEPFTSQLLQQTSAIPPGSILGPKYSNDKKTATLFVLLSGGVVPKMNLEQIKASISSDIKNRALEPVNQQLQDRLWREAVIEKL
ncbi:MAG: hypothetical protein ACR2NY_02950 [Alphaproteobacteria bacterium]